MIKQGSPIKASEVLGTIARAMPCPGQGVQTPFGVATNAPLPHAVEPRAMRLPVRGTPWRVRVIYGKERVRMEVETLGRVYQLLGQVSMSYLAQQAAYPRLIASLKPNEYRSLRRLR